MRETINLEQMKIILNAISDTIIKEKKLLTKLDAECGDGDFGVSMYIGFVNVKESIEKYEGKDIGSLLKNVGYILLSSMGGASGPLFGTFFIAMGEKVKDKSEIDLQDFAVMVENSLEKIRLRGGAEVGDKTLVDALEPATRAIVDAIEEDLSLEESFIKITQAAERGAISTKNLISKKGKSRYLGEKSIGYQDPGAVAMFLIFKSIQTQLATKHK